MHGVFDGFYHAIHPTKLVIDTNRAWHTKLALVHRLYPDGKIIWPRSTALLGATQ